MRPRRAWALAALAALGAAPPAADRSAGLVREVAERVRAVERRLGRDAGPRVEVLRVVAADVARFAEERGPDGRLLRVRLADLSALEVGEDDLDADLARRGPPCPALARLGAGRGFLSGMDAAACGELLRLVALDALAARRLPPERRAGLRYGDVLPTQPGLRAAEGWDLSLAYLRRQARGRGGADGADWAVSSPRRAAYAERWRAEFRARAEEAWRRAAEAAPPEAPWVPPAAMTAALDSGAAAFPAWTADAVARSRAPWTELEALAFAPTARDLPPLSPWAAEELVERVSARAAAALEPAPAPPPSPPAAPWFLEVPASESGLVMPPREAPRDDRLTDQMPGGMAVLDYDGDGRPDLFVCDFDQARLFRNLGGLRFEDASAAAGLAGAVCRNGASSADYDGDGRPDLLLLHGRGGRDTLWRDEGGRFRDVSAEAGLSSAPAQSTSAVWLDYDGDGRLDLFLPQYGDLAFAEREPEPGDARNGRPAVLYRNAGGRFVDVSAAAGVAGTGWGLAAAAFDADGDGRTDLLLGNDFGRAVLYRNRGDGTFEDATAASGLAAGGNCMGVSVGDYDGDGIADAFLTYIGDARPEVSYLFPAAHPRVRTETMDLREQKDRLFRGLGGGRFEERAGDLEDVPTGWGWSGMFLDAANSGRPDVFQVNGWWPYRHLYDSEVKVFWRRDPATGRYRDATARSGLGFAGNSRAAVAEDFDGDGCLDLVVAGFHAPRLFRGLCPKENHWLVLRLEGTRSVRDGIGAKATVRAGGRSWTEELGPQGGGFQTSARRVLRFGLGTAARVDRVEVAWPSGARQLEGPFDADRTVAVRETGAR